MYYFILIYCTLFYLHTYFFFTFAITLSRTRIQLTQQRCWQLLRNSTISLTTTATYTTTPFLTPTPFTSTCDPLVCVVGCRVLIYFCGIVSLEGWLCPGWTFLSTFCWHDYFHLSGPVLLSVFQSLLYQVLLLSSSWHSDTKSICFMLCNFLSHINKALFFFNELERVLLLYLFYLYCIY